MKAGPPVRLQVKQKVQPQAGPSSCRSAVILKQVYSRLFSHELRVSLHLAEFHVTPPAQNPSNRACLVVVVNCQKPTGLLFVLRSGHSANLATCITAAKQVLVVVRSELISGLQVHDAHTIRVFCSGLTHSHRPTGFTPTISTVFHAPVQMELTQRLCFSALATSFLFYHVYSRLSFVGLKFNQTTCSSRCKSFSPGPHAH